MTATKTPHGTAANPHTTLSLHEDNVLCTQLKERWMGLNNTSTDPIIEGLKRREQNYKGYMALLFLVISELLLSLGFLAFGDRFGFLLSVTMAGILIVGFSISLWFFSRSSNTYYSYNRAFTTLVDAVGYEHFMECWRLNSPYSYPMLLKIIKVTLVQGALDVLRLEDQCKWTEAEAKRGGGFKPLHMACRAFSLVEEKWDGYFLQAALLLAEEKAGAAAEPTKG